jgi:hypothetical protein
MKIFNCVLIIFVLIAFISMIQCIEKVTNAKDALKSYPSQDKRHGMRPKYIYITMKKNLSKDLDYYSKIFYMFLSTVGVRPYFVNLNDSQLLGIVPHHVEVNLEAVKENFEDLIQKIEVKDKLDE